MSNTANIIKLFDATYSTKFQPFSHSSSERLTAYTVEKVERKSLSSSAEPNSSPQEAITNNFSKSRLPLPFEQQYFDELLKHNDIIRNQLVEKFTSRLVERMRFYNYDQDSEDMIWPIVDNISAMSISVLGASFQKICVQNYDCPNILCAIAKCLCSFDLSQTAEWGPMILISLLNHKNDHVKEYAVLLLDNWEDRSLLPILKNLDCHVSWLKEYVNSIVSHLER